MLGENQLRKQIDRAAPRRDSDDFTLKLWNRLDIRLADEVELWFRVDDQRLHADRTADENRFKIESFLTIKAFHLRDSELQLRYSDGGCRKVNLLKLCRRCRRGADKKKHGINCRPGFFRHLRCIRCLNLRPIAGIGKSGA